MSEFIVKEHYPDGTTYSQGWGPNLVLGMGIGMHICGIRKFADIRFQIVEMSSDKTEIWLEEIK